jgi:stage V sporulation protein G
VRITEVRIKLMEEPGERLKAFCSVTFDDCFVVRDLKIIEGTNGPFVAMPSRKLTSHCPKCGMKNHLRAAHCNHCGSRLEDGRAPKDADGRAKLYADIAHPINSDCREMIQESVIREFSDEIERAKQPGYVSRYDDFDFEYSDAPRSRPARVDPPHSAPAPMSRKVPANTNVGAAARPAAQQLPASRPSEPRPQRRNDLPADSPRPAATSEAPKGDNFGAGIFPER